MQRLNRDDGAVAVLVAILVVVTVGLGAFVIDIGALYAERRQLQNAADAGVLAAVQDCASVAGCTEGAATAIAELKANQNSNDQLSAVLAPDGYGPAVCGEGSGLTSCSPASGLGSWDCRPVPSGPLAQNYVQVRTQTLRPDSENPSLMPPRLARVLAPGYEGATIRACARASWGGPAALDNSLALTISYCEWDLATSGDPRVFAPEPPAVPLPTAERVLKLHSTDPPTACPIGGHAGSDGPGAFGWLGSTNEECTADLSISGEHAGRDPGANTTAACHDALIEAVSTKEVIYIPVYKIYDASAKQYQLEGFAAFIVTGYKGLPAARPDQPSWLYPDNPAACTRSEKCIYGYFTRELAPSAGVVGGLSMGVTVYQMSG